MLIELLVIFVLLSSFFDVSANPATKKERSNNIPARGFWIIKEMTTNKQLVTVLYYNNENHLIRKETRSKRYADTSRKKVVRSLKRSLVEAIDWTKPI